MKASEMEYSFFLQIPFLFLVQIGLNFDILLLTVNENNLVFH